MKNSVTSLLSKLALATALVCTSAAAQAATFNYHIDINTAALMAAVNSPFYLDFQLNEGSGSIANSATVSNVSFTGGALNGAGTIQSGIVTGSLASSLVLNSSTASPFAQYFQAFTTSTSSIHFDVSVTENAGGVTPDEFALAILDSESGFPQLFTNAPDTASLSTLNLGAANTLSDVMSYSTTSPSPLGVIATASPISTASPVPEPSTTALAGVAALGLLVGARKLRKAKK